MSTIKEDKHAPPPKNLEEFMHEAQKVNLAERKEEIETPR